MRVLVINCGSSTLKFDLIQTAGGATAGATPSRPFRGVVDRIGGRASMTLSPAAGEVERDLDVKDHADAARLVLQLLASEGRRRGINEDRSRSAMTNAPSTTWNADGSPAPPGPADRRRSPGIAVARSWTFGLRRRAATLRAISERSAASSRGRSPRVFQRCLANGRVAVLCSRTLPPLTPR
jgi:hypothetical protein